MGSRKVVALLAVLALVAAACSGGDDDAAPDETPTDSIPDPETEVVEAEPVVGRPLGAGDGGDLVLLQWDAPTQINSLLTADERDLLAGSLVLEPLAEIGPDGALVPALAADIPTARNDGISADGLSITWELRTDVVWSDGSPFTAADVVFTYEYCADPATGCAADTIDAIESVVADGDWTVTITFTEPQPYPYAFGVGYTSPIIQQAQMGECLGETVVTCDAQNASPVGTGPYVVTELQPGNSVSAEMNPFYRGIPDGMPFFGRVEIQGGGGDPTGAAQAVLESGVADYAWNLEVPPDVLAQMEAAGEGRVASGFTALVEHLSLNQTDPDADPPSFGTPHPLFVDNPDLVLALSLAIDRDELVAAGYGATGAATCNIWPVGAEASTANDACLRQNVVRANALLNGLGYDDTDGDGIREADDFGPLEFDLVADDNEIRRSNQELIASHWEEIGVRANLVTVDSAVFFDRDCIADGCSGRFLSDMQMFATNSTSPYAVDYLANWTSGQIPTPDTNWSGTNIPRLDDSRYDNLNEAAKVTPLDDPDYVDRIIDMNDILSTSAVIPLVHRASTSAWGADIVGTGALNGWDSEYWNIEAWARADPDAPEADADGDDG